MHDPELTIEDGGPFAVREYRKIAESAEARYRDGLLADAALCSAEAEGDPVILGLATKLRAMAALAPERGSA